MPPRTLGAYEVLSVIGRGGVSTVYRARHRETGEVVAVKLLGPPPACDPGAARRLAREFEALRGLDHPNVVRVHGAGVYEGYSFLVMELVEGLDLRSYLSPAIDEADAAPPCGPAPAERGFALAAWSDEPDSGGMVEADAPAVGADAIRAFAALMEEPETYPGPGAGTLADPEIPSPALADARPVPPALVERLNGAPRLARLRDALAQVCDALGYVHARGLVHRDLKPSNVMVDDARRVRLMDFGLVKHEAEPWSASQHGRVVGTYRYMAPEQARGDPVDRRADLYSIGVVLYELLCGRPPFTARRAAELWEQILSAAPPPITVLNPGADRRLARIAERLLAKDPRDRYPSAGEVAAALRGG